MRPNLKSIIVLILLYNVIIITVISVSGQELQSGSFGGLSEGERDKRALDLGWLVRNILLKSAYASNTKAAVSRNLINAKLAKTTTTTTTTTTPRPTRRQPVPPTFFNKNLTFFGNKKSFLFPFDFSASSGAFQPFNKFNNVQGNPAPAAGSGGSGGLRGGYMNFDYDYVDPAPARRRRPTTTTAAPTTTTPEPPPPAPSQPAALPPRRRPFKGYAGRPQFLHYDYYDDYDYPENEPTPAPPPPPSRRPRPRQQRPPQQNQSPRPVTPSRTGARQDRPPHLRDRLINQYAQNNDISINNGNGAQTADNATPTADNDNANANTQTTNANDETDDNADADDDVTSPQDTNEQNNQDVSSDDYDEGGNSGFDPSNVEDNNDSSDNANVNPNGRGNVNGNGANNDDTQLNTGNDENGLTNQSPFLNFDNNPAGPPLPSSENYPLADFPIGHAQGQGTRASQPFGALFSGYQNYQYPSFNGFNTQYQQPSSPIGYSVRYY